MGGVPTYVVSGTSSSQPGKTAILFISDVFGWNANNRRAADFLAKLSGAPVYLPNFFGNDTFDPSQFISFILRHGVKQTQPLVDKVVAGLKALHGGEGSKIGAIGFCWGGKYALRLGAQGQLSATVAAHPSLVQPKNDKLTQTSSPVLFLVAEGDPLYNSTLKAQTEDAIKGANATLAVKVYQGVSHGFTLRPESNSTEALEAQNDAFAAASAWFNVWLAPNSSSSTSST